MPSRLENINEQKRQTLERLRKRGIDPYPNRYQHTHTARQAVELLEEAEKKGAAEKAAGPVSIAGRIRAVRKMGKSSFLDLWDSSGKLQLLFRNGDFSEVDLGTLKELDIGDIIGVKGTMMRTRTGEPTLVVSEFTLLAKALQPLPDKWHGLSDTEIRYRQRYIDLIANAGVREIFQVRSRVITEIRRFMDDRGFIEVETPVLHGAAGGALAAPFITHHNALDRDLYMRIALELHHKRLIVGGFDKVYEISHVFRNEGISTTHSPEYTLLESYEAYADYMDVMKMTEEMIFRVAQQVLSTAEIVYGDDKIDLTPPWKRMTLREAVKEYSGIDFVSHPTASGLREKMRSEGIEVGADKNWAKLVDELLTTCVKPKLVQPTFVYDYPVSMSPLAKNKPGEDRVVERFQCYAGGLELGNAYSELNDPLMQRERFEEQLKERQGDDEEKWTIDEDYLAALEYGMPPTGGLGIGVDRLVMLFTDQQSIREVILFPQLREKE
jgi:lysyl-tRNA synthetase class 2